MLTVLNHVREVAGSLKVVSLAIALRTPMCKDEMDRPTVNFIQRWLVPRRLPAVFFAVLVLPYIPYAQA